LHKQGDRSGGNIPILYFVVGFSERLAKDIVERTEGLITQKKEV
jgi:hypothetical protein